MIVSGEREERNDRVDVYMQEIGTENEKYRLNLRGKQYLEKIWNVKKQFSEDVWS